MRVLVVMYALLFPCAVLYIHTKHIRGSSAPLTVALKAASTTIIVLAAIVGIAQARESMRVFALLVAGGLVFGLVGDVVICQKETGGFLSGMIYFAMGHLCYIGAFLGISTHVIWAVPVFLVIYGIFLTVVTRLAKKFANMFVPTAVYGAVIASMVSLSASIPFSVPKGYILLAAAVLFMISDGLLAYNILVSARETDEISFLRHCYMVFHETGDTGYLLDWISLGCYFAAQSLFAVSIFCL